MTLIPSGAETNEQYHASGAWGSSRINDFVTSPLIAHLRMTGQMSQDRSSSLRLGSALHARFDGTYGDEFAKGPNVASRRTKAWQEAAAATSKTLLLGSEVAAIDAMEQSIRAHRFAACILDEAQFEVGVRRQSPFGDYQLQCRIDALVPGEHLLDLKTTADLDAWSRSVEKFGYARQMAFYRWLYRLETGEDLPFTFLVVESAKPYRCRAIDLTESYRRIAWDEVEEALYGIGRCYETGVWPDPDHLVLDAPGWKVAKAVAA